MNDFATPEGKEWIKGHLAMGPMSVTFTKKDGTERVMNCTLKTDLIKDYEKKTDRVKSPNEDTCPVYDLDLKEWRSFRFDSIKGVKFSL